MNAIRTYRQDFVHTHARQLVVLYPSHFLVLAINTVGAMCTMSVALNITAAPDQPSGESRSPSMTKAHKAAKTVSMLTNMLASAGGVYLSAMASSVNVNALDKIPTYAISKTAPASAVNDMVSKATAPIVDSRATIKNWVAVKPIGRT